MNKSYYPSSIANFFFFLLLGAVLAGLLFWYINRDQFEQGVEEEENQEEFLSEVILSIIPELKSRWIRGDKENSYQNSKWTCDKLIPNKLNVDTAYFECNPDYLSCVFSGSIPDVAPHFETQVANKNYQVIAEVLGLISKSELNHPVAPAFGIKLRLSLKNAPHLGHEVILEDTCRMTYLPERLYRYKYPSGVDPKKSILWDNFHRSIYIDRFMASNRDVKDWVLETKQTNIKFEKNPNYWPAPSVTLNLGQRKKFCSWRGAKLLEAPIYQAATFLPQDLTHPMGVGSTLSETSWAREKNKTLFAKNANELTIADCEQAYVKECEGKPFKYFSTNSSSWSGIFQIMGGISEQMRNPIHSNYQFKTSTKDEEVYSSNHLLGDLTHSRASSGFRCFKEVEQ